MGRGSGSYSGEVISRRSDRCKPEGWFFLDVAENLEGRCRDKRMSFASAFFCDTARCLRAVLEFEADSRILRGRGLANMICCLSLSREGMSTSPTYFL